MRGLWTLGLFAVLAGCGGASRAPGGLPRAPGGDKEIEQSTDVDALLRKLDESERDLHAELGGPPSQAPAGEAMPAPDETTTAPSTEEAPAEPARPPEPTSAPKPSPCDVACRALDSMRRSATRICELTGDADERCNGARTRVTRAAQQVERAGCACS